MAGDGLMTNDTIQWLAIGYCLLWTIILAYHIDKKQDKK